MAIMVNRRSCLIRRRILISWIEFPFSLGIFLILRNRKSNKCSWTVLYFILQFILFYHWDQFRVGENYCAKRKNKDYYEDGWIVADHIERLLFPFDAAAC